LVALALSSSACGSSSGDDDDDSSNGSSGSGSEGSSGTGSNAPVGNDLPIVFSPMYSGYDGDNHTYKLPAIVSGVSDVEWSCSDPEAVYLEPDTSTGGVMITTRKAGSFKIIARAGALSGQADLHVTEFQPGDWAMGEARYNNNIPFPTIMFDPDAGMPMGLPMIPTDLSCGNCHGSGAMALDVEHTPQQTGGYSDDDLKNIFSNGMKPPGAKFHTMFPTFIYMMYHKWSATEDEKRGLVAYLRGLEPKTQGMLDFSGLRNAAMGANGGAAGAAP
jgi:hypothetical protein